MPAFVTAISFCILSFTSLLAFGSNDSSLSKCSFASFDSFKIITYGFEKM